MTTRREVFAFGAVLAIGVAGFFHESLFGGKVLSPADVLRVSASFRDEDGADYEPANRLLMDPVLQFQPWLEFNRQMIRGGRLPLWNGHAGCGAPHLANGQSAVFDPFHLIAYLGPMPQAYAWIAAGRLEMAGLGMFLLAGSWGLGFWGRWFAGLVYPFCGFVVVWLLFPVTAVAIWMPWLLLATDRLFRRPGAREAGWLAIAIAVAVTILGGHIQTSAHVLIAAGLYALTKGIFEQPDRTTARRALLTWGLGACLGLGLAAVQVLPLGYYLSESSVWSDRQGQRPPWWRFDTPRLLDSVCTAVPYAYGSQRRGHPNLARALGVHNLNESAGGHAGLATLCWLAPLAVVTRGRTPRVGFLTGLVVFGAMGAFGWPPVDNLLRALPVLDVTDNRRLTLWVAFGLTLLGGIGLDQIGQTGRLPRAWFGAWALAGLVLASSACAVPFFESTLRERARAHYRQAALSTPGADTDRYQERADRQVRQLLRHLPRYHALVAIELGVLTALAAWLRRSARAPAWVAPALIGVTLFDLAVLGFGLNPAIGREVQAFEPRVIARLRAELPPGGRALGLGEELPPNTLMRFGLDDVRNYDSVELRASLAWLGPLYEPTAGPRSSRGEITWRGVVEARERLLESGVCAVVAASPPPDGAFERVERVGRAWIAWQGGKPWADCQPPHATTTAFRDHGQARVRVDAREGVHLTLRETWAPGWKGWLDGEPVDLQAKPGVFVNIDIPSGQHEVIIIYDPMEVRLGTLVSVGSLVLLILVLTENRMFWIPGITIVKGLDGPEPSG